MKLKSFEEIKKIHQKQIKKVKSATSAFMLYQFGFLEGIDYGRNKNDKLENRATKICLKIFSDYSEEELSMVPRSMQRVWLVGRSLSKKIPKINRYETKEFRSWLENGGIDELNIEFEKASKLIKYLKKEREPDLENLHTPFTI